MAEVKHDPDFLSQSGVLFIRELLEDGNRNAAPFQIQRDRKIIADWIGYTSGHLSPAQTLQLGRAWNAYLAIGLAPSEQLQHAFTYFAERSTGADQREYPPTEIMHVFDRLLATDEQINLKRAADLKEESQLLSSIFAGLTKTGEETAGLGWWRRQTPLFRNWAFSSAVWATFMLAYALFFDPFGIGGWRNMSEDQSY